MSTRNPDMCSANSIGALKEMNCAEHYRFRYGKKLSTETDFRANRERAREAARKHAETQAKEVARMKRQRMVAKELRPVREHLGLTGKPYPIVIVDGFDEPELQGQSYHWVTRGGRPVRYPSAYNRVAKSSPAIYVASTLRIVVGAGWLIENGVC